MALKTFENEAECIVYPEANIFKCGTEQSTDKEGAINVIDGQLVWDLPPEPEKMSMKFTYDKG